MEAQWLPHPRPALGTRPLLRAVPPRIHRAERRRQAKEVRHLRPALSLGRRMSGWCQPDPDRYPRESNDIARAANETSRKALRLTLWLGIPTLFLTIAGGIVTYLGIIPGQETNQREKEADKEEKAFEAGSPVKISAGESYYGPSWYAKADDAEGYDGDLFNQGSTDPNQPSWSWLRKHWTPLNSTGIAVNVLSKHKHTVLVQGVEISHLKCTEPETGAIFAVPPIGDGGSLERPAEYALNVEATRPVSRKLTDDGLPGPPARVNVTLEQGDQREIQIEFFSSKKSCTFQAALIISSEGKKYREKLPAYWGEKGNELYTFRVTAPGRDFSYRTRYVTVGESSIITRVPSDQIRWDKYDRPEYVGAG